MKYQEFIKALLDTTDVKKDVSWKERWRLAEIKAGFSVDGSDPDYRHELQKWFFENGSYEFQEYWTTRKYFAQLCDSVGLEPDEESDMDKVYETKGKNQAKLEPVAKRLKDLEIIVFLEQDDIKSAVLAGKADSLYHAGPLERRNKKKVAA